MAEVPQPIIDSDLECFGYRLLGPYLVAFCRWIRQHRLAAGADTLLLFTARDAYMPLTVYRSLYPDDQACVYLLASRISGSLTFLDTPAALARFLGEESSRRDVLDDAFGCTEAVHAADILDACRLGRQRYLAYLETLIGRRRPIVVDIGYKASTQNLLARLLGRSVAGLYLVTHASARAVARTAGPIAAFDANFIPVRSNAGIVNRHRHLIEAVLTEPKGTFLGIGADGKPRFAAANRDGAEALAAIVRGVERHAVEARNAPPDANAPARLGAFLDAPLPRDAAAFSSLAFDDLLKGAQKTYLVVPPSERRDAYALWVSGQRAIDRSTAVGRSRWPHAIEDKWMSAGLGGVGYACYATNRRRFISECGGLARLYRRAARGLMRRITAWTSLTSDS